MCVCVCMCVCESILCDKNFPEGPKIGCIILLCHLYKIAIGMDKSKETGQEI